MIKIFLLIILTSSLNLFAEQVIDLHNNFIPIIVGAEDSIVKDIKFYKVKNNKENLELTITKKGIVISKRKFKLDKNPFLIKSTSLYQQIGNYIEPNANYYMIITRYENGIAYFEKNGLKYKAKLDPSFFKNNKFPQRTLWSSLDSNEAYDFISKYFFSDESFNKKIKDSIECKIKNDINCFRNIFSNNPSFKEYSSIKQNNCEVTNAESYLKLGHSTKITWVLPNLKLEDIKEEIPNLNIELITKNDPHIHYFVFKKDFERIETAGFYFSEDICTNINKNNKAIYRHLFIHNLQNKNEISYKLIIHPRLKENDIESTFSIDTTESRKYYNIDSQDYLDNLLKLRGELLKDIKN